MGAPDRRNAASTFHGSRPPARNQGRSKRRPDIKVQSKRAPKDATRPGGLGAPFDWYLLENLDLKLPYMVSGGLHADNVAEALRVTGAGGVDVSSGVESAPGVKDPELIKAFIRAARATQDASQELSVR